MSKHNQSASLGSVADFATRPQIPEPMDTEARLDRIETRLENIEKLLNTVLYGINDINEAFDKVSKQPQPKPQGKSKPQHAPNGAFKSKDQEKSKPKQAASNPKSGFKQSQIKSEILNVLGSGKPIPHSHFGTEVLSEFGQKLVRRILQKLHEENQISMDTEVIDEQNITFVSLASSDQGNMKTCKAQILQKLSEVKKVERNKVNKTWLNSDFSNTFIRKTLDDLRDTGEVIVDIENQDGKQVVFVYHT